MCIKKVLVGLSVLGLSQIASADIQNQINALQSQIDTLQQQLSTKPMQSNINNFVGLDTALPIGTMSKTAMPLALLQAKPVLNAPWILGGQIELDLEGWGGDVIPTTNGTYYRRNSDLALSKVYLFNMMNMGPDVTGFFSVINSRPSETAQVDRAFLVFGNLQKTPFYLTAGYTYLPFGSFSGNGVLDDALTTNLFRVSPTDQVIANAKWKGLNANFGLYSPSTSFNNSPDWLANASYTFGLGATTLNVGAGYLTDVRGANSGIGSAYTSGSATSTQPLQSNAKVPVYDLNFSFGIPLISLIGEYDATTRNTTENGNSAGKLSAWMLGTAGKFALMNIPYKWQISYSETQNMANVPMKLYGDYDSNLKSLYGFKSEWMSSIAGEVWENVYVGPEFSYNKTYTNNLDTYTFKLDLTAYF